MLRKLPLAMAIALAISPLQSHALGLGKIQAKSVLNQPFDAEIQLLSVPLGELDSVKVELASGEAFNRAGVDRPYMLTKLKFRTMRKANGEAAIVVNSRQPISEPFLNFLVEVNWPQGRMVREFTVLLDPPLSTGRKAVAVATPVAQPTSSSFTPSAPVMQPAMQAVQPSGVSTSGVSNGGQYGPVKRNETLWTIANGTRPAGASVNQMMLAILKANPQAFGSNNINTLKAGSILRIPGSSEVMELTREQANQLANQQYQEWKQGVAPQAPAAPAMVKTEPVVPEPEVKETSEPVAKKPDEAAHLKLSGAGDDQPGEGEGENTQAAETLRQELLTTQEKVITAQAESDELRLQLEELQARMLDMERLIELKDQQLSQIQSANAATPIAESEQEVLEPDVSEVETPDVTETPDVAISNEMEQPEAVTDTTPAEPEQVEPVQEVTEPAEVVTPAAVDKPEAKPEAKGIQGIIDMITGNVVFMGIAVLVLVVLLALIWAAFSRGRNDESQDTAKPDQAAADSDTEDMTSQLQDAQEPQSDDESSFLSEFAPADLNDLDNQETGEVDPISEADVYIAYGRFDQAEEMVLQALQQEPGNVTYQHKLLEIYYANKETEKFVALAQNMKSESADQADVDGWNRAKLMGVELDPENPLFEDAAEVASQDLVDDLDVALSELESQLTDDLENPVGDLDSISEELEDLDLGELAGKADADITDDLPEMDLSSTSVADSNDESSLSLDLESLGQEVEEQSSEQIISDFNDEDSAIEELAQELESFDINSLESESEDSTDDILMGADDDLLGDLSDADEMDDVSTKIDLAKAYIEMGDKDGAKGILEEVVSEGSDAQRQQAEALISEIS